MKLLLAGFEGYNNSAKILLDAIDVCADKIYLHNDKIISVQQIVDVMENYDLIFAFGQKPVLKDKIVVEQQAKLGGKIYVTDYPIDDMLAFFKNKYPIKISSCAGTSFCNNLYAYCLEHIKNERINMRFLFLHIPMMKNISNFNLLVKSIEKYCRYLLCK